MQVFRQAFLQKGRYPPSRRSLCALPPPYNSTPPVAEAIRARQRSCPPLAASRGIRRRNGRGGGCRIRTFAPPVWRKSCRAAFPPQRFFRTPAIRGVPPLRFSPGVRRCSCTAEPAPPLLFCASRRFVFQTQQKICPFPKKVLTNAHMHATIYERSLQERISGWHGGIAQLARAFGSYPTGRWFKSDFRYQAAAMLLLRPVGQAAKTRPFHGCNMGSIPVRVTKKKPAFCKTKNRFLFLQQHPRAAAHLQGFSPGLFAKRPLSPLRRSALSSAWIYSFASPAPLRLRFAAPVQ